MATIRLMILLVPYFDAAAQEPLLTSQQWRLVGAEASGVAPVGTDHDDYDSSEIAVPSLYLRDWPDTFIHTATTAWIR